MPPFLETLRIWATRATPRWHSLSQRLLAYVAVFVLLAEIFIFMPNIAAFRSQWLMDRVEAAQLASLALEAAPDAMVEEELAAELLANAEVKTVLLQRDGRRQLILRSPEPVMASVMIDLRTQTLWGSMAGAAALLFAEPGRFIRVAAQPRLGGGEEIVVVLAEDPLRRDFAAYARRILINSILISVVAGVLIYWLLSSALVGPMTRLAGAMVRFRQAPQDAGRIIQPSGRADEIGVAERELASLQEEVRQALRQRERLAALGSAVAKINHDLRNVLTSAQLISDRLASDSDPRTRSQGERLVRSIGRGVRLAEDVLQYGRAEEAAPQPTRVGLRAAAGDAFDDAAAAVTMPVVVSLNVAADLAVWADPEHLHRILLNLMRNAAQAMASQPEQEARITVSAQERSSAVVIMVADTGPGIPKRAVEKLFAPFAASTRKGGSGLGLTIARELARANGGDVTLNETCDAGAAFEVRLPAAAPNAED